MISVILYGRNDNYGYNLHKRAALSLNCIAEVLDGKDDEILFVDYNTPDDMPTFIEAILDTLTDRARTLIRVLRARPELHRRFQGRSRLQALEPVSRNIAVRRSNPNNRWILSTNTDMVFVQRAGHRSLTQAVADLAPGYYGVPRYEMPESLWESLDRKDPKAVIAAFTRWGRSLHLDEVVHSHRSILFDAPGDFQLMPRDDLFRMHGFHEGMLLGWHVDSNLAKRFLLLRGATHSLFERVASYHCDHTKVATPAHGHDRQENSIVEHVSEVKQPYLPEQAESWGAPDVEIEELRFPPGRQVGFATALEPILGPMPKPVYEALYTEATFNQLTYPARHVLPYLADQLSTYPRDITLAYAGLNDTLRDLLVKLWRAMGFTGEILVLDDTAGVKPGCTSIAATAEPGYLVADVARLASQADLFIFDYGVEDGADWPVKVFHPKANPKSQALLPWIKALQATSLEVAAAERVRATQGLPPRRMILVNTINTEFAGMFGHVVAQTVTPYCTRVRHGFIKQDALDLLSQRRADADRLGRSIADGMIDGAFKTLPFDLWDQRDPHLLLSVAQRSEVAQATTRMPDEGLSAAAKLALSTLTGDLEQSLAAYLDRPGAEPDRFRQRLWMLRMTAGEAMTRPWSPERARIVARACADFLAGAATLPQDLLAECIASMIALCRSVAGQSLDELLATLSGCASSSLDVWSKLSVAALLAERGAPAEPILNAALSCATDVAPPVPKPGTGIALIVAAPWRASADPAAAPASALIEAWADRASLMICPLVAPDAAFVAFAERHGVPVLNAPLGTDYNPMELQLRVAALADAIRARGPRACLLLGDSVTGLAVLAQRTAPVQAAWANRIRAQGLAGVDTALADPAAIARWMADQSLSEAAAA